MKWTLLVATICLLAGCSSPKLTLKVDVAFTQQAVRQTEKSLPAYGNFSDLTEFYLTLPPPPVRIVYRPPIITPAPGAPDPYAALLAFIQAGPQGHLVTRQHLVQLTPPALALAQLYLTGGLTNQQVLNSPQAWALLYAAQAIFQPILTQQGLWNQTFVNSWIAYLTPRQSQLISIATTLHMNIVSPPPPGQPTVTPQAPLVFTVNPVQIIQQLTDLWRDRDWLIIAERFPDLIFPLIRHAGFSKPMIVLYGSRRRYYGVSASTTRIEDGQLEVHNLNREGYFKNEYASGAGRYFQGEDDISLTYFPVMVKDKRVETLDVIASDRFALLKRMSGGDVELLSRAYTHNTALLSIDAAFNNRHLRVVAGTTPYASIGGVMGEITYEMEHLKGRIGGGGLIETGLHGNTDTFLGFLDMEHTLSSPYAMIESKDEERAAFAWVSLTLSASGMADRALTNQTDKRLFTNKWGFQGDIRLIPELHTQLDTKYFSVYAYGGVMTAVVPAGRVDLYRPDKSVMLDHIRTHFGVNLRILVTELVEDYQDEKFDHMLYADVSFVVEVSALVRRTRFTTDFTFDLFRIGFVAEAEDYQFSGVDDMRLGGRLKFMNVYVEALKSLELDDYRIQAGFEIKI